MIKISNYINGELTPPANGQYIDLFDPSVGQPYAKVPDADAADVELAVAAGLKAFPAWAATSINERSRILNRIADLIEESLEELAKAESVDNGKPVTLARAVDIPRSAANFRFFAQAITQFATQAHEMTDAINYTLRQPLGVVGTISPWNLPLYLFTWKIAPALAAGNAVIAKPSEVTPMTAYLLSEICIKAGLPKGVLNIIHGDGIKVGAEITKHPKIKAISFTGSTRVGQEIAKVAAPMFKKMSLEMGGKNPNLIFADCNYDKMLETTIRSSFANQGQICLCGSRLYIESSIYEKFKKDFVERVKALKVGPPADPATNIGALVSKPHYEKVLSYIELAKSEGGTILAGGEAVFPEGHEKGWYVSPTIIEGLPPNCRTNQEEIFGPVVTIMPFDTDEEVLAYANGTNYGLACTVWTENITRANRIAKTIESGIVWVNTWMLRDLRTPFGGVKSSGVGREGGFEALRFFTEAKNVCIQF
ncbi:aldehyde dehydrogenase [Neolewinella persica]|uniref:aldehyde dehydrogenase n=1 Tax=Neolewinella persica TaxID=70998 RepID=UPI00037FACA9|nr:aldehyde dehydrogenase [Neolewinella persica]